MVPDNNTEGNRNEGACLCKSTLELLILSVWPGTEDRGHEKMHVDAATLQNVRRMTNRPISTANCKGSMDKEEEGEQDGEKQRKRRRPNRRLT